VSFGQNLKQMEPPIAVRLLAVLSSALILLAIRRAKRGRPPKVRRIPGIDAIDEALGRATEMGRPVLFSPGIGRLDNMMTIAALSVLKYVAQRCARFWIRVIVPIFEPVVLSAAGDILREAYRTAGVAERFDPSDVQFHSKDESAYAMGVTGVMRAERAAAGFYFGSFGYESLLIAEAGNKEGIIQVAATADFFQIPFFICACDYVLIGEELYAAGAYLSQDPVQTGALAGQDAFKTAILILTLLGVVFALVLTAVGSSSGVTLNPITGILLR
jgi:hypothetical protein